MQRGRDHGIPGYNEWRQWSGQQRACDWNTPPSNIREDLWQKFYREGGLAGFNSLNVIQSGAAAKCRGFVVFSLTS